MAGVALSEHDALFLDLDGTILDIASRPQDVAVPTALTPTLARLRDRLEGALALISGRRIDDIDRLFAPLRLPAAGVHGAELRLSSDGPVVHAAPPVPDSVRKAVAPLGELPGVLVEDKGSALAVHYRLAPSRGEAVYAAVCEAIRADRALTLMRGKYVCEIRYAAQTKGTAIARFMEHPPWRGRRPIFIGDDATDEHGFAELARWSGIGIAVGQPRRDAQFRFQTPAEVRAWLEAAAEQKAPSS